MDTPAPIPLAMGTTISPTAVTLDVIAVEETHNIKLHQNTELNRLKFYIFQIYFYSV